MNLTEYLATQRTVVALLATLAIAGIILGMVTIFRNEAKIERLARVNRRMMKLINEQEERIQYYTHELAQYKAKEQNLKNKLKGIYNKEV